MSMVIGPQRLIEDLQAAGLAVDGPFESNRKPFVIVRGFVIPAGPFAQQVVDLAVSPPADYPATPPGGLHVSPPIAEFSKQAVHDQPRETTGLPGGKKWQYWSRPVADRWEPARGGKALRVHWNTVFATYKK